MQLIAEAYDLLRNGLDLTVDEIANIFLKWNKGVLDSFLIDITANILKFKDEDGEPMVDKILDKAGQKGTGKWTAIAALDAGTPGRRLTVYLIMIAAYIIPVISHLDRRGCLCSLLVFYQGGAYTC